MARINYFNNERSKLYGYSPTRRRIITERAAELTNLHDAYWASNARRGSGTARSGEAAADAATD
jgi:hypothetical protein